MIRFYFHHTPNPMKVALLLEESGLTYEVVPVDPLKGDQHDPNYRRVNPNGKLPAIEDDGHPVFDSNAILLYLAERTGQFDGRDIPRGEFLSWLMFVATGLGPFSGQAVHFTHFHTDSEYATNRYQGEVERHYGVLDERLGECDYIAGNAYSIVDMAAWGWVDRAAFVLNRQTPLRAYPNLERWYESVNGRPAAERARAVGKNLPFKSSFDDEAKRAMFPQTHGRGA